MIHPNSVESLISELQAGKIGPAQYDVLTIFAEATWPLSDRDVMRELGYHDMNKVRPRITELIERGLVVEVGREICAYTGKKVRVSRLAQTEVE